MGEVNSRTALLKPARVRHPRKIAGTGCSCGLISLRNVRAGVELAFVGGTVEMALRLGDEAVGSDLPLLETANVNAAAGAVGAGVRADEGPMVFGEIAVKEDAVHEDLEIGEGGHEGSSGLGDGGAADRRSATIDAKRTVRRKERGYAVAVLAAPGGGVAPAKVSELLELGHYRMAACEQ